ncbi:outer membrane receptor protein involved in Fe transport [Duganella sp. 3397]|uniref:outer membrane beta-barrel family protein n=1 Tax=Duganella sp. 3397 TaxID=2817732 RepID=UPI0028657C07|nr:outer membrane beta-barrel family protein [Duganella sp. 3397]MDR7049062.1 outer membrane receptor protein involved in Fe transport [Duganella sp. 3397]
MQKILLTCSLLTSPMCALAQTTAAPAAAPGAKPGAVKADEAQVVPSVTVAAERPTNRIDRQVYDVKSDVSSTNGTAADALNNVPSVAVDPDGTVSLRGSSNVQIMIDGKPSAMLQGENRGAALQAMPADDIESVEVINNPGAQFGNEGGGGPILNLVMRRNRKPGGFGSVNANAGTEGRYNSAVNGSYNEGLWGFQGGLNVRHDGRNSTSEVTRERLDPRTGQYVPSTQDAVSKGLNDMVGANGTVSYNMNQSDTLTGSASFMGRGNDQRSTEHYVNGATGFKPANDYVRNTARSGDAKNFGWGARYDHKGELPGETLKIDLRVSASENDSDTSYASDYATGADNFGRTDPRAFQHSDTSTRVIDFTGDYSRPLWGGTTNVGYKVARTTNNFDTLYTDIDPVTNIAIINPSRTNRFDIEETVLALYGTYQMRLSERWGLLGGVRTEHTDMDIHQVTSGIEAKNSYINFIPSMFATYKVSDDANLRFAYARRLRRPQANDLNPYVTYRDEFNVSSGNPDLKPTKTDSFEVGYETKFGGLETNLRGYYRRDTDAIVDYRYFIADNVLLTTRQNGEGSHSSGLEFTVSGKLTPTLTLNTSGNLMRSQQRSQDEAGVITSRTANSLSGRARLNWQMTTATQVQLALQMQGKTLSGQGYRSPNNTVNMSVRHALSSQWNLVANVTDIFDRNKMETIVNSTTLRETSTRRFDGRVFYVGLSYRFGGVNSNRSEGEGGFRPRPGGPGGPGGPGPGGFGPPGA